MPTLNYFSQMFFFPLSSRQKFYAYVYVLILFTCCQAKDCLSLNLDENGLNLDVFGKVFIEISQRDSSQIPDQVAWHRIINWRIFSVAWC